MGLHQKDICLHIVQCGTQIRRRLARCALISLQLETAKAISFTQMKELRGLNVCALELSGILIL